VVAAAGGRDRGPIAQLLVYPATDLDSRRRSHDLFAHGFYITRHDLDAFRDAYVGGTVPLDDPPVSPPAAASFGAAPPTLVAIAGFDPLRDDGEAYAAALANDGVRVRTLRFPSLGHGFIHLTGVAPAARRGAIAIARAWRELVGGWGRAR